MSSQKRLLGHWNHDETEGSSHPHQAGAFNYISDLHPSKNGPSNGASHSLLLDDASTVAHDAPLGIINRVSLTTTGPTPVGDGAQVYLVSEGNLTCTPSMNGTQWNFHQQTNPKQHSIFTKVPLFNSPVHLGSDVMSKAFSIHMTLECCLNEHFSLLCGTRSKDAIEFTVTWIKSDVEAILDAFPESVVLIRCYFPFYDSVDPERRVIIEHAVVEYFRSPWRPEWKHRVRSALVQMPGSWFKSVTEEKDEVFLVANQTPAATLSLPALDDLMESDPQPPSTAGGSAETASLQGHVVTYPFRFPPLSGKPCMYCG